MLDCIGELQDELHTVLEELRAVAAEIYPPLLDEAGLGPALGEMADRLQVPLTIVASGERFGPAAEGAAYFAVTRCLTAQCPTAQCPTTQSATDALSMTVVLRRESDELVLSISGVEACHVELLENQVWPLGGRVAAVDIAQPGAGTITARIPCE